MWRLNYHIHAEHQYRYADRRAVYSPVLLPDTKSPIRNLRYNTRDGTPMLISEALGSSFAYRRKDQTWVFNSLWVNEGSVKTQVTTGRMRSISQGLCLQRQNAKDPIGDHLVWANPWRIISIIIIWPAQRRRPIVLICFHGGPQTHGRISKQIWAEYFTIEYRSKVIQILLDEKINMGAIMVRPKFR